MTTPDIPDNIDGAESPQLPPNVKRQYISDSQIPEKRAKGIMVYTGPQGGSYISEADAWVANHKESGVKQVEDPKSPYNGMFPVDEHSHDVYEYENGDHATAANAPKDDAGKAIPRAKDEHGNFKIVEQNEARNHGHKKIPKDAKEVHIAHDPKAQYQAKWRTSSGKLDYSLNPEEHQRRIDKHWKEYKEDIPALDKVNDVINSLNGEDFALSATDTCLALVCQVGIRHGAAKEARIHEDGKPTGVGALTLRVDNVKVDGENITLDFRGKYDRQQHFEFPDAALAQGISAHMKGKKPTDRLFNTTSAKNFKRVRDIGENSRIKAKDFRTHLANTTAEGQSHKILQKYIGQEEVGGDGRFYDDKAFKKFQDEVGLFVGKALGHYKEVNKKGEDGKPLKDKDNNFIKETVHHGKEAIDSYIDPTFWDEFKPEASVQKAFTPDWRAKGPKDERDIDKYAETRKRKEENRIFGIKEFGGQRQPLVKTWMESLQEQGFFAPLIKDCTPSQMWFLNNGIDYVGTFGMNGHVFVEKATFKPTFNNPGISYNPSGRNKDGKTTEPRPAVESLEFDGDDSF